MDFVFVVGLVVGQDGLEAGGVFEGFAGDVDLDFQCLQAETGGQELEFLVALCFGFVTVLGVELGAVETDEAVENAGIEGAVKEGVIGKFLEGLWKCGLAVCGLGKFQVKGETFLEVEVFGVSPEGGTGDAEAQSGGFRERDACGDFVEG